MIDYEENWVWKPLLQWEGGQLARRSCVFASFSAALAVAILFLDEYDQKWRSDWGFDAIIQSQLWAASTSVLALLLGFRTRTAFSRFWEGTSLLHQMRGEWFDTVSNCVTFSISAKEGNSADVVHFRHTIVRLMSLCHGSALEEIASNTVKLETIDTFGLDHKTLKHLVECDKKYQFNKVEVMLHLVQSLITSAFDTGVLKVPPPILSRVFQTISRGFVNLLNAKKIVDTRFPFAYAQAISALLLLTVALTPMQVTALVPHKLMAGVFSFVPVWGLFLLNFVAAELEDPFGTDSNDLPLMRFQDEMNNCLLMLLHPNADLIPTLSDQCEMDFGTLLESGCSQRHSMRQLWKEDSRASTYSDATSAQRTIKRRLSDFKSQGSSSEGRSQVDANQVDDFGPSLSVERQVSPGEMMWREFERQVSEKSTNGEGKATLPTLPRPHTYRNANKPALPPQAWIYRARELLDELSDPVSDKCVVMSDLLQHLATKQLEIVGRELIPSTNFLPRGLTVVESDSKYAERPQQQYFDATMPALSAVPMRQNGDASAGLADDGYPGVV